MTDMLISPTMLRSNPDRVVILPFSISVNPRDSAMGAMSRVTRICDAIAAMPPDLVKAELEIVNRDFTGRHWQTTGRHIALYADNERRTLAGIRARQLFQMCGSRVRCEPTAHKLREDLVECHEATGSG